MPIGIKDLIETKDMPTGHGCAPAPVGLLRTRVIVEDADRRHSVVWRIDYIVGPKARDIADDRVMAA
jgi:hypothetical protein